MFGRDDNRGIENNGHLPLENIINLAISGGVRAIAEKHPRYPAEFLAQYLDPTTLNAYAADISKAAEEDKQKGIDPKEADQKAYQTLAGKVASGDFFTEKGKRLILRQSWEEKAANRWWWFGGGKARDILEGEKTIDNAMGYFKEIYQLLKSGEYAQRMPELAKAVGSIYDLGFFDSAQNLLYENGQLEKGRYFAIKQAIREKTKQKIGDTKRIMDQYLSQTLAAAILGIVGVIVLFTTNSITGNVIGSTNSSNIPALIFGALSFIFGIYFILKMK